MLLYVQSIVAVRTYGITKWRKTYTSVCADVHLQAIVLAECFVTVGALVWTLT